MWYLPLLSLNGILEAFHAASATPEQVSLQARWMSGSSVAFALTLFFFTHIPDAVALGTEQSLIYASCLGMMVRIGYAWRHARMNLARRIEKPNFWFVIPRWQVVSAALFGGTALRLLERTGSWRISWWAWMRLISTGGLLSIGVLMVLCVPISFLPSCFGY